MEFFTWETIYARLNALEWKQIVVNVARKNKQKTYKNNKIDPFRGHYLRHPLFVRILFHVVFFSGVNFSMFSFPCAQITVIF